MKAKLLSAVFRMDLVASGFLILLLLTSQSTIAAGPTPFVWVKTFDAPRGLDIADLAVDEAGNAYFGGSFFGRATIGQTKLASEGGSDAFVAKVRPNGEIGWVRQRGTSDQETVNRIGVDRLGNCYAYGSVTPAAGGRSSFFLEKYDADGQRSWTGPAIESFTDFPQVSAEKKQLFTVDGKGNCFFVSANGAGIHAVVEFESAQEKTRTIPLGDRPGVIGGVTGIVGRKAGGVLATAFFGDTIKLGGKTLIPEKQTDCFVACLDANGVVLWVSQSDCRDGVRVFAQAVDVEDALFVFAQIGPQETQFAGKSLTQAKMPSKRRNVSYVIVKYSASGTVLSALRFGDELMELSEFQVGDQGTIIATAEWWTDWGTIFGLPSNDRPNVNRYKFMGGIDSVGTPMWGVPCGLNQSNGYYYDYRPHSLAVSRHGEIFLVGRGLDKVSYLIKSDCELLASTLNSEKLTARNDAKQIAPHDNANASKAAPGPHQTSGGDSTSPGRTLANLSANNQFAHLFPEYTKEFAGRFANVALAVGQALKKQREGIVIADTEKGVFSTKATTHGLSSTWYQYAVVLEKVGESAVKIHIKIMMWSPGERISDYQVKLVPETNTVVIESKIRTFLGNIQKCLDATK